MAFNLVLEGERGEPDPALRGRSMGVTEEQVDVTQRRGNVRKQPGTVHPLSTRCPLPRAKYSHPIKAAA